MTFDEIKIKLSDYIQSERNGSLMCRCPAHEDDKASLSVSHGKDGATLIHCFAGCTTDNVLRSIGMTSQDLFSSNGNGTNGHRSNGYRNGASGQPDPVVATYDYRDSDGNLVFQVQRKKSKQFVQRRPDGNGGWVYKVDQAQKILYRLPELLASGDRWVLIPEGEKDVNNLADAGYIATTNAGGAKAPWLDGYSEALHGRKVCILPDNDGPGRQHASDVANHLVGIAADVRILELPELPEKGDVSDWIAAGNDPKLLRAMIETAPVYEKPVQVDYSLLSEPSQPALDVTADVIQQIAQIASSTDIADKKATIANDLAGAIGLANRASHALIVDELVQAGFTKTAARDFLRDCVAMQKAEARQGRKAKNRKKRDDELVRRQASGKGTINVEGQLSSVVDATMGEILKHNSRDPRIFVRGGTLVRIVKDENEFDCIEELSQSALLGYVSRIAVWERVGLDRYGNEEVKEVYPPRDVVSTILAAGDWEGIPALAGIAMSPVFTKKGDLHKTPGYNSSSRLFYTGGVIVGDTTPTEANIKKAKELILDNVLVDFPFKDEASRAHAVAYMLLPFVRSMIDGPTPVHVVDSPTAGTGKGKLLNACAFPFIGHDVSTMAAAKDDDEWRKRITTSLIGGSTHLVIDNVNHELDSGSLASAFTQPVWEDRTLGANRDVKIPVRTAWAITGNNISMSQELARRSVWIRLDSNTEMPWLRNGFKHEDLLGWIRQNRNDLVTAILTLVQAWIAKEMPKCQSVKKGSYEAWAGVIGGILETVSITGFLTNESELYETVISTSNLMADFVAEWWKKYESRDVPTGDLFKLASRSDNNDENKLGDWKDLLSSMLTSQKQHGRQTQLGNILKSHRDKIVAGFKIKYAKAQRGMAYWRLEKPEVVEPQSKVLPHKMSTDGALPLENADLLTDVVEPGRTFSNGNHVTREIFSCPDDQGCEKKNNILYSESLAKVLPGSTTNGSTSGSDAEKVVEPQIEGSTTSVDVIGFDEDGEVITWML